MRVDLEIDCKGMSAQPVNGYEFRLDITDINLDELVDAVVSTAGADEVLNRMDEKEVLYWVQELGFTLSKDE